MPIPARTRFFNVSIRSTVATRFSGTSLVSNSSYRTLCFSQSSFGVTTAWGMQSGSVT